MNQGFIAERYEINREINRHAAGATHEAIHRASGRKVFLEIFSPQLLQNPESQQRFLQLANQNSQMRHEGLAETIEAGINPQDGSPFIATERPEGETLRALLAKGRIPVSNASNIFRSIAETLSFLHSRSAVHGCLRPENIVVTRKLDGSESTKILGFGLGQDIIWLLNTPPVNTPNYLAPEQLTRSTGVSPATDIWSVGIMLYEALSGQPPFLGDPNQVMAQIPTQPHKSLGAAAPGTALAIISFVDSCLSKAPQQRPQSVNSINQALSTVMPQAQVPGFAAPVQPNVAPTGSSFPGAPAASVGGGFASPSPAASVGGFPGAPAANVGGGFAVPPPAGNGFGQVSPQSGSFGGAPPQNNMGMPAEKSRSGLFVGLAAVLGGLAIISCCIGVAVVAYKSKGSNDDGSILRESGELKVGDDTLRSGEFNDVHNVDLENGQHIRVVARSTAFDAYLIVRSPSGKQLDADDISATETDASLDIDVTEEGEWAITVTSKKVGETGAYNLVVEERR